MLMLPTPGTRVRQPLPKTVGRLSRCLFELQHRFRLMVAEAIGLQNSAGFEAAVSIIACGHTEVQGIGIGFYLLLRSKRQPFGGPQEQGDADSTRQSAQQGKPAPKQGEVAEFVMGDLMREDERGRIVRARL